MIRLPRRASRPVVWVSVLVTLVAALASPRELAAQAWPKESPPAPLAPRGFTLPPFQVNTLPNGLQVLVLPRHEEPAVILRLIVHAGALEEPADRPGVAAFTASLLTRGTLTRTAAQIAALVDGAGATLTAGAGNEIAFVNLAVLKDQAAPAIALVADLVEHPAFAEVEVSRRRAQLLGSQRVNYDDPGYLATAVFERIVYGPHPYGRPSNGTPASIARIARADVAAFHQTWFVPDNALVAIVGDVTADEAMTLAERGFGGWARRPAPAIRAPAIPAPARRLVIVDRPGSAQTEIRVGHVSVARTHPDYVPLDLAVRVLGGDGANRLFGVLRANLGLTYSVSADLHTFSLGGDIAVRTSTRTAETVPVLRLIVDEFARLRREPVRPEELAGAQSFLVGNFPLGIEPPSALAEIVLAKLFYGQSLSEIDTYFERVARVTPPDVQRVARELLKPDDLSMVLVGDASAFVDRLKSGGFPEFERIPLAALDLDAPGLTSARGSAAAAAR